MIRSPRWMRSCFFGGTPVSYGDVQPDPGRGEPSGSPSRGPWPEGRSPDRFAPSEDRFFGVAPAEGFTELVEEAEGDPDADGAGVKVTGPPKSSGGSSP